MSSEAFEAAWPDSPPHYVSLQKVDSDVLLAMAARNYLSQPPAIDDETGERLRDAGVPLLRMDSGRWAFPEGAWLRRINS